jgi:hypothetical protein
MNPFFSSLRRPFLRPLLRCFGRSTPLLTGQMFMKVLTEDHHHCDNLFSNSSKFSLSECLYSTSQIFVFSSFFEKMFGNGFRRFSAAVSRSLGSATARVSSSSLVVVQRNMGGGGHHRTPTPTEVALDKMFSWRILTSVVGLATTGYFSTKYWTIWQIRVRRRLSSFPPFLCSSILLPSLPLLMILSPFPTRLFWSNICYLLLMITSLLSFFLTFTHFPSNDIICHSFHHILRNLVHPLHFLLILLSTHFHPFFSLLLLTLSPSHPSFLFLLFLPCSFVFLSGIRCFQNRNESNPRKHRSDRSSWCTSH